MKEKFLNLAFENAEKAFFLGEIPVGAVIVKNEEVISVGYNMKETKKSVMEHAEIVAIKNAEKKLSNWRLCDCDLYVTLDPCPMCASAIKQSRIKNVYSALENSNNTNLEIIKSIFLVDSCNPEVNFISNLNKKRSEELLKKFFQQKR